MLLQAHPAPQTRIIRWLRPAIIPLSVAAAFLTIFTSFFIPSQSMDPTLRIGDKILVARAFLDPVPLHRGDVVVFAVPKGWNLDSGAEHIVKRVIALPGDQLQCQEGEVTMYLNGAPLSEPYVQGSSCTMPFKITVAAGTVWVEGDNRAQSADSRYHREAPEGGAVPIEDIVGRAYVRFESFSSVHLLARS